MTQSNWVQVYEFAFGKKFTQSEIETWENEISAKITNLRPGEIAAAVSSIAEKHRASGKSRKYPPTGNNIISEIIFIRSGKSRSDKPTTPNEVTLTPKVYRGDKYVGFGVPQTDTMSNLKFMLDRKPDLSEAWDIICAPMKAEQCKELEDYCKKRSIPFTKFVMDRTQTTKNVQRSPKYAHEFPESDGPDISLLEPPADFDEYGQPAYEPSGT